MVSYVRGSYDDARGVRAARSYTVRTVFVRACRTPPSARFVQGSYDVPTSLLASTEALVRTRFIRGSKRDAGGAARVFVRDSYGDAGGSAQLVRTRFVRCSYELAGPHRALGSCTVRTTLLQASRRQPRPWNEHASYAGR